MIDIYKQECELIEVRERCKCTIDDLLDYYEKYPKECSKLLAEMVFISEELEEMKKEMEQIKNEIY